MVVRNKKNGTNTIAYRNGAVVVKEIILAGSVVDIKDLSDLNQVINKHDFQRGWFEVIEEKAPEVSIKQQSNELDKAKKEAEEYSEEVQEKKEKKTKKQ
jgi:hypothetical protein